MTITIDGNAVLPEKGSIVVEQRIEERSVADFNVVDTAGTLSFTKGEAVVILDPDGNRIFGGVVNDPQVGRLSPEGQLLHPIGCADNHYFADKRLVAESYLDKTCGFIVDDIFDNYLDEEGITIGNIDLGATVVEAVFNYVRVSDCFDAMAEKAGFTWFIDENKALYFQARDTTAAPWTLTSADVIKGSGLLSGANDLYRNRQFIRGGKATTAQQTETFTGDAVRVAFTVGYSIVSVPTVTVDAVGQTVGIKGIDTAKDCYWSKSDATIVFDTAPPNADAVVIVYYGEYDILALIEDEDKIAEQQTTEGVGTGFVEDMADEPTLTDSDAILDSGQAKLARFGVAGRTYDFQTVRYGLEPGQLLTVNIPTVGLNSEELLIESVIITIEADKAYYNVVAVGGPVTGSWANFFKALYLMKGEVIDRLNVGSEQILIILVNRAGDWEWEEVVTETVYACPIPSATLYPSGSLYPC